MAKFTYSARDPRNNIVKGTVEAANRASAKDVIAKQGLSTLGIKEEKRGWNFDIELGQPKAKMKDKVIFTRQLATMINAGVPLTRSLVTLSKQTESKALAKILPEITKKVESGTTFAEALAEHPNIFNDIYVNMIRAGEEGGILDDVLSRLATQQEKDAAIRGKLKSALTYPTVVTVITIIAFIFMMTVMVPKIGGIITDLAGGDYQLPIYTRAMLAISDGMIASAPVMVPALFGGTFFLVRFFRSDKGRPVLHRIMLKIPLINKIIVKVALARFARTFSALSSAGVGVLETLRITADAVGNEVIKRKLLHAVDEIKDGKPLSAPLMEDPLFPPILSQMIAVGEETGEIDAILKKLAGFYEEEVDQVADALTSIIEPILIVVLGGMVGLIAASIFGPLGSVSQNI